MDKKSSNSNGNSNPAPVDLYSVLMSIAGIGVSRFEQRVTLVQPMPPKPLGDSAGDKHRRFESGAVCWTDAAVLSLDVKGVFKALERHFTGDWGSVSPKDAAANERALSEGGRIVSTYQTQGTEFWIITEADRSVTTVQLPEY